MASVIFKIINNTNVADRLVVVAPQLTGVGNAAVLEWRTFPIAPGGSSRINYQGAISAIATDGLTSTAAADVGFGQILPIVSADNGGLEFGDVQPHGDPSAATVRNDSNNPKLLRVRWRVDGHPVMVDRGINQKSTSELQLLPALAFSTRDITPKTTLLNVSPPAVFPIDPSMTKVTVTWSRASAAAPDVFTFKTS